MFILIFLELDNARNIDSNVRVKKLCAYSLNVQFMTTSEFLDVAGFMLRTVMLFSPYDMRISSIR